MRRIVRAAYLGEKLGDTSVLENPSARLARQERIGIPGHSERHEAERRQRRVLSVRVFRQSKKRPDFTSVFLIQLV
jgi:hypothetical protein